MEILREAPDTSSFIPLAEHQSRTPASFYSGPPILYHFSERCRVVILERDLLASTALNTLRSSPAAGSSNGSAEGEHNTASVATAEAEGIADDKEASLQAINVWVTSEYDFLYAIEVPILSYMGFYYVDCQANFKQETIALFNRNIQWYRDPIPINLATCNSTTPVAKLRR